MMWEDVPFEARAAFLQANVMELSEELKNAYAPQANPGFENFRGLLLSLYESPGAFGGEDALERFHALTYTTQLFFSAIATVGHLSEDGEGLYLLKADFKKVYKKPCNIPFDILPGFGVDFAYEKKGKAVDSFAACDAFTVGFSYGQGIAGVLKQMSEQFHAVDHKKEYTEALVMLGKADFDRLVLGASALREDIHPLRPDILRSAGEAQNLYQELVRLALAEGFTSLCYLQRYANPTWNVNFYQGKKLRLKTMWCMQRNFIYVPVPFAKAEAVIQNRQKYHPRIREAIERFGCVNCGRCKAGKPVKFLTADGITVCTGHNESSTICLELRSPEEAESLFHVMDC